MIVKAYKVRIYPNNEQIEKINRNINGVRYIYNWAKETKDSNYKDNKISLSRFDLNKRSTRLKVENPWLYTVDSRAIQHSIKDLDMACELPRS